MRVDSKSTLEGLFERCIRKEKEQIMTYDGQDDFIANKILLEAYIV